jgi:hypothetical protein
MKPSDGSKRVVKIALSGLAIQGIARAVTYSLTIEEAKALIVALRQQVAVAKKIHPDALRDFKPPR